MDNRQIIALILLIIQFICLGLHIAGIGSPYTKVVAITMLIPILTVLWVR